VFDPALVILLSSTTVDLARAQFATTTLYHFLFVPQHGRKHALVVSVDGNHHRPDQEHDTERRSHRRQPSGSAAGSFQQIPLGAQRQVGGAVKREDGDDREPRQQRVGVEQVPKGSIEVALRVDRGAVQQVREADTPDQRGAEAADRVRR
jgi:hypothetical protein